MTGCLDGFFFFISQGNSLLVVFGISVLLKIKDLIVKEFLLRENVRELNLLFGHKCEALYSTCVYFIVLFTSFFLFYKGFHI